MNYEINKPLMPHLHTILEIYRIKIANVNDDYMIAQMNHRLVIDLAWFLEKLIDERDQKLIGI